MCLISKNIMVAKKYVLKGRTTICIVIFLWFKKMVFHLKIKKQINFQIFTFTFILKIKSRAMQIVYEKRYFLQSNDIANEATTWIYTDGWWLI